MSDDIYDPLDCVYEETGINPPQAGCPYCSYRGQTCLTHQRVHCGCGEHTNRAKLREVYHTDIGTFSKGSRYVIDNPEEGKGGYICRPEDQRIEEMIETNTGGEFHTVFIPGHLLEFD
jgi:hypothetical protein